MKLRYCLQLKVEHISLLKESNLLTLVKTTLVVMMSEHVALSKVEHSLINTISFFDPPPIKNNQKVFIM